MLRTGRQLIRFSKIKTYLSVLGLNQAIYYSLLNKTFSAVAQPTILYFIAKNLSFIEQGYYYTFYSILALNIFLELELGVVITHFSSNEFGTLSWTPKGALQGDGLALSRLLSIIKKSLVWYGAIVSKPLEDMYPFSIREEPWAEMIVKPLEE